MLKCVISARSQFNGWVWSLNAFVDWADTF